MKILLINPAVRPDSPKLLPNVGLAYIATALKNAGIDFEILDIDAHRYSDEEVEKLLRTKKFDAVGIGTLVSQYKWCKTIAHVVKGIRPNAPVIVGNTLGTSVPEILLQKTDVDIAVLGEGDITIIDLLTKLNNGEPLSSVLGICYKENGKIHRNPNREVIPDIDQIPFPDYDLFDVEIYLEKSKQYVPVSEKIPIAFEDLVALPVNTARGCPYSCTFCYHAFQEKKYRHRSPENIAAEFELWRTKYGVNFVNLWDELSFYHNKATEKFADIMIEKNLGVSWVGTCRSDLLGHDDLEIAMKLKQAGCVGMGWALENANREIQLMINKGGHADNEHYIRQAELFHEADIDLYSSVLFGYPQESETSIKETFAVLRRAGIYPSVGFLQPMPGTPMHLYAVEHGFIKDEEEYLMIMGDRQDVRINMTKMSTEHMEAVIKEELAKLNQEFETGLAEEQLIKTRAYRAAKTKDGFLPKRTQDSFLQGFGIAAEVAAGTQTIPKIGLDPEASC
jgi:radical SAM superfamily enzyme YgiQ (UPF0313 family)